MACFGPTELLGWVDGTEPGSGIVERRTQHPVGGERRRQHRRGLLLVRRIPVQPDRLRLDPGTGVVDVNQWLADNGVLVDPNFTIQSLTVDDARTEPRSSDTDRC